MTPTTVCMLDGGTHELRALLSEANHKQRKGEGYLSVGLTLTPRDTAGAGRNLCRLATRGCGQACFAGYDRMAWPQNKRAAVARSRLLAECPAAFLEMLKADLGRAARRAARLRVPLVCRLNVVSDVPFEREMPCLFADF